MVASHSEVGTVTPLVGVASSELDDRVCIVILCVCVCVYVCVCMCVCVYVCVCMCVFVFMCVRVCTVYNYIPLSSSFLIPVSHHVPTTEGTGWRDYICINSCTAGHTHHTIGGWP